METAKASRAARTFGTVRSFPPGTYLCGQGEQAEDVYLIHEGVVKLTWHNEAGGEVIIGLRWPGWFVGAPSSIIACVNPAAAVTVISCTLERIARNRFLELLRTDEEFAMRVHESQSREILEQMSTLGALACTSARIRLETFLKRLVTSMPQLVCLSGGRLQLPLKRKELAALLAITGTTGLVTIMSAPFVAVNHRGHL